MLPTVSIPASGLAHGCRFDDLYLRSFSIVSGALSRLQEYNVWVTLAGIVSVAPWRKVELISVVLSILSPYNPHEESN